jgi:general secretion pathway protein M
MIKPDREVLLSLGALGALLVVCVSVLGFSLQARSEAAQELDARSRVLSQLEARIQARDARPKSRALAPATAFLTAPTQGLAGAQFEAYLQQMAAAQHATIISSGLDPTRHEDRPDSIRLQATLDMNLEALQRMLYQLESGTPYVFVDSLSVQIPGTGAQRAAEDPLLRVTLGLRAIWQRDKA